jgi:cyclophilin family peptidyl-prolyl cis-trans isomerase
LTLGSQSSQSSASSFASCSRRDAAVALATASSLLLLPSVDTNAAYAAESSQVDTKITDKVFFNVRISRQDGSFYVRDDLDESLRENRVFRGTLIIGLFGKNAPVACERFLSYVVTNSNENDNNNNNPLPNYATSSFTSLDELTGLLLAGSIPSLELTSVSGASALRYGDRILPAPLWIDTSSDRISHTRKGLLTHRLLDATPVFGITTRSDTTQLDKTHVVFGQVLDNEDSKEFFQLVNTLPTYSVHHNSYTGDGGDAAQAVFAAQQTFFRNFAKELGDTRVEKVYQGKFLRRVEVTQVGLL